MQVGSHFHFAEANGALSFNRDKAIGMRLDIPSGTSVRFEPGEENRQARGNRRAKNGQRSQRHGRYVYG